MEEHVIVDSSFSAIINAPIERIDIRPGASRCRTTNTRVARPRTSRTAHNRQETPFFAASIERHARRLMQAA